MSCESEAHDLLLRMDRQPAQEDEMSSFGSLMARITGHERRKSEAAESVDRARGYAAPIARGP